MKGTELEQRQESLIWEQDSGQLTKYKAGEIKDDPSKKSPLMQESLQ